MYVDYVDCTASGRDVTVAPTSGEESAFVSSRVVVTGELERRRRVTSRTYFSSSCLTTLISPSSSVSIFCPPNRKSVRQAGPAVHHHRARRVPLLTLARCTLQPRVRLHISPRVCSRVRFFLPASFALNWPAGSPRTKRPDAMRLTATCSFPAAFVQPPMKNSAAQFASSVYFSRDLVLKFNWQSCVGS